MNVIKTWECKSKEKQKLTINKYISLVVGVIKWDIIAA